MTAALIDLEGTLITGKAFKPIDGAARLIKELKNASIPVRIVTNNTTDSSISLFRKLNDVGISVEKREVISVLDVLGASLRPDKTTYVIGATALHETVSSFGCRALLNLDNESPDYLIIGGGAEITNELLSTACTALLDHRAVLIGLHKNRLYVDEHGKTNIGVGAIINALEYASNTEAIIVGKPSRTFFDFALNDIQGSMSSNWCVSDDPYSDLVGAHEIGMKTIFVTTGKYSREECAKLSAAPDFVFDSLDEVRSAILGSVS
jgi:4-nitrophenyl phosphatase